MSIIKKRNKKRDSDRIINNIFRSLDIIEQKIAKINKKIDEGDLNKNFDNINMEINDLLIRMSLIVSLTCTPEYMNGVKRIDDLLNRLISRIMEVGINSRQDILNKLEGINRFNKNNEEIKEIIEWIWDELGLDQLGRMDDIRSMYFDNRISGEVMGVKSFSGISLRQIKTLNACLKYSLLKNIPEAVHSLSEFIDNYQYTNQPFTSFEKVSIMIMIQHIAQSID